MRVVVDTNILVSFAIRPNSVFKDIFDHIAEFGTTLVSEDTIDELLAVLVRDQFRKYIPLDFATEYVDWYIGISEQVFIEERVTACRDSRDDKFLDVAINGHADFLVSGDADLLALNPFRDIPIITPAAFWQGAPR